MREYGSESPFLESRRFFTNGHLCPLVILVHTSSIQAPVGHETHKIYTSKYHRYIPKTTLEELYTLNRKIIYIK